MENQKIIKGIEAWKEHRDMYHVFVKVFDLIEIRMVVARPSGISIEIRPKEQNHNIPHIHAKYQNDYVSISLIDGSILAGNIPHKKMKIAIDYILNNKESLLAKYADVNCTTIIFPTTNMKRLDC